jgi:hypothetical protein
MQTENLKSLRDLRIQEKALKARINEISSQATQEAVAILSAQGLDRGEFTIPNVGTFQLQRTDVFDFADYHKYQQEQAVKWRENAREKLKEQNLVKARTAVMAGYVETFKQLYPDKQPDDIKLTVKVILTPDLLPSIDDQDLIDECTERGYTVHGL